MVRVSGLGGLIRRRRRRWRERRLIVAAVAFLAAAALVDDPVVRIVVVVQPGGPERAPRGPVHRGEVVEERPPGADGLPGGGARRRRSSRRSSSSTSSSSSGARRRRGRTRASPVCRRRRRRGGRRGAVPPARVGLLPLPSARGEATSDSACCCHGKAGDVGRHSRGPADGVECRRKGAMDDAEIDGASRIDVVVRCICVVRSIASVAR